MKIVIYSVNTGSYDQFMDPPIIDPNVRYILFTDNKYYRSNIWEVNHVDFIDQSLDTRKKARFVKLNPHKILPKHDISIWVDSCYKTKFSNTENFLKEISFNDGIMCFKHNERNCIYDEAKVVVKDKLDYAKIVEQQMNRYKSEGFPKNYGLFDSGFTIRSNNDSVNKFNERWWLELNTNSSRDQLSQVYSSWVTNIKINPINVLGSIYENKYLTKKIKHPKRWTVS